METDRMTQQVNRVCDEYSLVRPKVSVTWKAEKMCYHVRCVFMGHEPWWAWDWLVEDEMDLKLLGDLFDGFVENWAQDANIPITGEFECSQHLMSVS